MAYESRVSKSDLFGVFSIAVPPGVRFLPTGYYTTLQGLYPLLQDEDFKRFQTGYYINGIRKKETNREYLRLTYFTQQATKDKLVQTVKDFITKNNLKEFPPAEAKGGILAKSYGGEQYELRFRNYLSLETQIGLEILKSNPQHAKSLMVTYRLQVFATRSPMQPHLEPTFLKRSQTYRSLSEEQRQQFWADASLWPNPPQVDWAHFLVNLVLGTDWSLWDKPPFPPFSIRKINEACLPEIGFTIDPNWTATA